MIARAKSTVWLPLVVQLVACGGNEPERQGELVSAPATPASLFTTVRAPVARGFLRAARGTFTPVLPGPSTAQVSLPATAQGSTEVRSTETGVAIAFRLRGARDASALPSGGRLVYSGAAGGHDLVMRPHQAGVEDFIELDTPPADEHVVYEVKLTQVAGVRSVGRGVEFLDTSGTPRLRMAPPWLLDAGGAVHWPEVDVSECRYDADPSPPWDRSPTAPAADHCLVTIRWRGLGVNYPALLDPSWTATGDMALARKWHRAALLPDGRALVAGGDAPGPTSTSELFDPTTGTWASTGSMADPRRFFALVALDDGSVLAVGGARGAPTLSSAELFSGGSWSAVGSLATPRQFHAAARLGNGRVLVCGGLDSSTLGSCELYDPTAQAFGAASAMAESRRQFTLTALSDGRAVAAAGLAGTSYRGAEVYDPVGDSWTQAGVPNRVRYDHSSVLLPDGRVLMAGGYDGTLLSSAELFDPTSLDWTSTASAATPHDAASLTVLSNGGVLLAGGCATTTCGDGKADAELFDPASEQWVTTASLRARRVAHADVRLADGRVLVAGGSNSGGLMSSAEVFATGAADDPCNDAVECASGSCTAGRCDPGGGGAGGAGGGAGGSSAGAGGSSAGAGGAGGAGGADAGAAGAGGIGQADSGAAGAPQRGAKAEAKSLYGCGLVAGRRDGGWLMLLAFSALGLRRRRSAR